MLDAAQDGLEAVAVQVMRQVLRRIVQRKAAVRQPDHAAAVRVHAGEHRRPAGRAGGRGVEAVAEQRALRASAIRFGVGMAWP